MDVLSYLPLDEKCLSVENEFINGQYPPESRSALGFLMLVLEYTFQIIRYFFFISSFALNSSMLPWY